MGSLEVNVSRVPDGAHAYEFTAAAGDIGLSDAFRGDVSVSVNLDRRGRQFLVAADIRARGVFLCDRCLREVEQEVPSQFSTLFVPEGFTPQSEGETGDEVRTIPAESQVIELDEDVRQAVELAVPIKMLCREECKGLCRTCGADLNETTCACDSEETDPRWEPLKKLSRS